MQTVISWCFIISVAILAGAAGPGVLSAYRVHWLLDLQIAEAMVRSWSFASASQHQPAVLHEILIPGQVMNQ